MPANLEILSENGEQLLEDRPKQLRRKVRKQLTSLN